MENKEKKLFYRPVGDADNNRWLFAAGLDEMRSTGCYTVQLWHGNGVGELPLPACDDEHYIVATLIVTESGTADKLQKNRAIGQTLILSQCNDGQTGIYYRSLAPVNGGIEWSEWNALLSTGQFNEIADGNASITLDVKDNSVTAQKLSADVRKKVDSPLRPLYIAAGAEYNDSGVDKTKTAPWGETVTHKAGHYYLNGLGDITEEQMEKIYTRGVINENEIAPLGYSGFNSIRTNLGRAGTYNTSMSTSFVTFQNTVIEIVRLLTKGQTGGNMTFTGTSLFGGSSKLRIIDTQASVIIKASNSAIFSGCKALEEIRLKDLSVNVFLSDSPSISKQTVKYAISNASATSAIAIKLHPDAYVRLVNDAEIVEALQSQPLVSLVSA